MCWVRYYTYCTHVIFLYSKTIQYNSYLGDDTAILAIGDDTQEVTEKLQTAVNQIYSWTKKWRIKLNETKSVPVDFTYRRIQHIPLNINNNQIPYSNTTSI